MQAIIQQAGTLLLCAATFAQPADAQPGILSQIGALLLGAVPTMLLFIALVVAYQLLVQGPLSATLKERRARTVGAQENAHKAIAEAEARAAEYAQKTPPGPLRGLQDSRAAREAVECRARRSPGCRPQGCRTQGGPGQGRVGCERRTPGCPSRPPPGSCQSGGSSGSAAGRRGFPLKHSIVDAKFSVRIFRFALLAFLAAGSITVPFRLVAAASAQAPQAQPAAAPASEAASRGPDPGRADQRLPAGRPAGQGLLKSASPEPGNHGARL